MDEFKAEFAKLKAEFASLRERGLEATEGYGLVRFPMLLYTKEWDRLFALAEKL